MGDLRPSEIFPLAVGNKWSYSLGTGLLFSRNADVMVSDKRNNFYLFKITSGKFATSVVVKSDVDMSIIAYSKTGVDTLQDEYAFEEIPKIEILKSPLMAGASWDSSIGRFNIVSTDYRLKLDKKTYSDCVYLQIRDTSNALNDIFIRKGVGIVFASVYIDGFGKVQIRLRNINGQ